MWYTKLYIGYVLYYHMFIDNALVSTSLLFHAAFKILWQTITWNSRYAINLPATLKIRVQFHYRKNSLIRENAFTKGHWKYVSFQIDIILNFSLHSTLTKFILASYLLPFLIPFLIFATSINSSEHFNEEELEFQNLQFAQSAKSCDECSNIISTPLIITKFNALIHFLLSLSVCWFLMLIKNPIYLSERVLTRGIGNVYPRGERRRRKKKERRNVATHTFPWARSSDCRREEFQ